uniref:Uncharacterized protein n=1 Tax=Desertifilum tharense IPPAS B-1220 TaxID=1781255 RepID=A0ACD5GZ37_9CYAN
MRKSAVELYHEMKVETQGSVGAKNQLTPEEIAQADAVVIAADTHVDLSRFNGKRLYQTSTKKALKDGKGVVQSALSLPAPVAGAAVGEGDYLQSVQQAKAEQSAKRSGPYKHLLTGVSYMLPVIVAGGLIIALSFVFGLEPQTGNHWRCVDANWWGGGFCVNCPRTIRFYRIFDCGSTGFSAGVNWRDAGG